MSEERKDDEWEIPDIPTIGKPDESIDTVAIVEKVYTEVLEELESQYLESKDEFVTDEEPIKGLAIEVCEADKKKRAKFKEMPPKKRTTFMTLIMILSSGFITLVFSVALHFSPMINQDRKGLMNALPGNFITELMILWLVSLVAFFVLLPLFPYLSKLYIFAHKLVKLFKFEYSIVETDEHYLNFKEVLSRILIPYLFSFVLGYWISTWFFIPNMGNLGANAIATSTLIYFLFSLILLPLTILFIAPLWLLDDTGIISMKKRKEGDRKIPDMEGPTVFFFDFFTGSTYTLAAITFVKFFINLFSKFSYDIFIAFWFIILLILPAQILPIIYLYENFMRKSKRKLLKILPDKLVDKTPKTVVDISALDPFSTYGIEVKIDKLDDETSQNIET